MASATIFRVPFLEMQPLMNCSGVGSSGVKHSSGSIKKGGVYCGIVKWWRAGTTGAAGIRSDSQFPESVLISDWTGRNCLTEEGSE